MATTQAGAKLKKAIESFSHRHRTERVFADFVELSAIAVSNSCDYSKHRDAREAQYMKIVAKYEPEEVKKFPEMLAFLVEALEERMHDALGLLFHDLDLGSKYAGQFFTPYELCKLMAGMTVGSPNEQIDANGFITFHEPAVGAGAMVIALAEHIHQEWHNYQQSMHVTAIDVDPLCVHMAYLQFSLLNIPAVVIHGNSLSLELWSHWYTPAHILGGWQRKLSRRKSVEAAREAAAQTNNQLTPDERELFALC